MYVQKKPLIARIVTLLFLPWSQPFFIIRVRFWCKLTGLLTLLSTATSNFTQRYRNSSFELLPTVLDYCFGKTHVSSLIRVSRMVDARKWKSQASKSYIDVKTDTSLFCSCSILQARQLEAPHLILQFLHSQSSRSCKYFSPHYQKHYWQRTV